MKFSKKPLVIEAWNRGVHIIVHALGYSSDTLDAIVKGNQLWWVDCGP